MSVLTNEQIEKLTQKDSNDWSRQPQNRPKLAKAFKEGHDEVAIGTWTFSIKYVNGGLAWVQNTRDFVPCGWFNVEKFVKEHAQGA